MILHALRTGNCQRVAILLEELGLDYRIAMLDFAAGDLTTADFLAINPVGQVPAITVEDGPDGEPLNLSESAAIMAYLARREGRFVPVGGRETIEADRWIAMIAGGLQNALTTIFFARMMAPDNPGAIVDTLVANSHRYLRVIDQRLSASPYLAGDRYTYADMLFFTIAERTLGVVGLSLAGYPAIDRWRGLIADRPAVERGMTALAPIV